jgi:hypothetical protein
MVVDTRVTGPPDKTEDFVIFGKKKLREIGSILPRDSSDDSALGHVVPTRNKGSPIGEHSNKRTR